MTVKRIGPRLTLAQQLLRNRIFRGRQLAMQVTTPGGNILRAKSVIGKSQEQLEDWMERVDRIGYENGIAPVDDIVALIDSVELKAEEIFTLKAGRYRDIGRYSESNSVHDVVLPQDIRFFPLTFGFLKQFRAARLVRQIANRDGNRHLINECEKLVGWMSVKEAFELMEIINPALVGDINLRLPAESAMEALLSQIEHPFNQRFTKGGLYLTRSRYCKDGIVEDLPDTALSDDRLDPEQKMVYVYRFIDHDRNVIGKHWDNIVPFANNMNSMIIFEVGDSAS